MPPPDAQPYSHIRRSTVDLKPMPGRVVLCLSPTLPGSYPVTPRLVRVAAAVVVAAFFFVSSPATAQDDRGGNGQDDRRSLDLGVSGVGISIGDSRRWTGL